MSTSPSKQSPLDVALGALPATFRKRIIKTYLDVKRRHAEAEFDASGLSVGKFCETVLRFLQQELTGTYTPFGQQLPNFANECAKLAQTPKTAGSESLRIVIPRAIDFLYTLRNKRGIGHAGGDVDANEIDSATMARGADWVVCELIRTYHNLSLEDAQALVDSLATRNLPSVWEVAGRKRVLRQGLRYPDQVLLLLYGSPSTGVLTEDLYEWCEYSDFAMFKKSVLGGLHKKRLVEYDRDSDVVYISPLGGRHVEENILGTDTGQQ
jgi:hypothetical protein